MTTFARSSDRVPIVLASGNQHKLEEYRRLLPGVPLKPLTAFPRFDEPEENAADYQGNAIIKAEAAAAQIHRPCLADDSGLEVAALDWGPGIRSARYAVGTDADRRRALLAGVGDATDRRARFCCAIAVAGLPAGMNVPRGVVGVGACYVAFGQVHGTIGVASRGSGGFGYDPIFDLPGGARSMAMLLAHEKDEISHRGRAAAAIRPFLESAIAQLAT